MKKVVDLFKPFLALVLGILMFLFYLNYYVKSGVPGTILAIGIVGLVIACWFVFVGIFGIAWPRMPVGLKKAFDIVSIVSFATFIFVELLIEVIQSYAVMGASSWIVYILAMVAALGLSIVYIISRFVKGEAMARVASIFGMVFVLALISKILFPAGKGEPVTLEDIRVVPVLIYLAYCSLLLKSLAKEKRAPAPAPIPVDEQ